MPRANRHYLPGHAWHITHRCHKQEFLLKFAKDRRRWLHWLFEAKKRYGLCVLNYIVTSNHIHLLVMDTYKGCISNSMQLIAGRTAQEYNQRKQRKGAFWEDRYYATAIDTNEYLGKCITYIDLNMVRTGVIDHPSQWKESGYNEIQHPSVRYNIINRKVLMNLLNIKNNDLLVQHHHQWCETELLNNDNKRNSHWSSAIAVGSRNFVDTVKHELGHKTVKKHSQHQGELYFIQEQCLSYKPVF